MTRKWQFILLAVLFGIAALIWYANSRPAQIVATASLNLAKYQPLGVDNQQLHWQKLESARKTEYAKTVRNIFSEVAPPPVDARITRPVNPGPIEPPKPMVSPLPVKFFGFGLVPINGPRLAFFTDGDDVFIVGEGETLLGRFRVLRIGNNSLEYEEIASGLRGTVVLEEQGPSA
jgi:hypothetical protein